MWLFSLFRLNGCSERSLHPLQPLLPPGTSTAPSRVLCHRPGAGVPRVPMQDRRTDVDPTCPHSVAFSSELSPFLPLCFVRLLGSPWPYTHRWKLKCLSGKSRFQNASSLSTFLHQEMSPSFPVLPFLTKPGDRGCRAAGARECFPSGVTAFLPRPSAGGCWGHSVPRFCFCFFLSFGSLHTHLQRHRPHYSPSVAWPLITHPVCPSGQGREGSCQKKEEGRRGETQKEIDDRSSGARWELGCGSGPGTSHLWVQFLQTCLLMGWTISTGPGSEFQF